MVLPFLALLLAPQQPAPAPPAASAVEAASPKPGATTLAAVRTIYILQMGSGFDQFLASALARDGHFEVVTDPSLADAILTERVGKTFEKKFEELYPKPKPVLEEHAEEADADAERKPGLSAAGMIGGEPPRTSNFGGGKGTVFLVGRSSRSVLWSSYEKPKTLRPADLNATAKTVARQLGEALKKSVAAGGGPSQRAPLGN